MGFTNPTSKNQGEQEEEKAQDVTGFNNPSSSINRTNKELQKGVFTSDTRSNTGGRKRRIISKVADAKG